MTTYLIFGDGSLERESVGDPPEIVGLASPFEQRDYY
jgi:hypothetical protein